MANTSGIDLFGAVGRGIDRMRTILFRPFDFGKWIVIGFTAWLAQLLESCGGNGGSMRWGLGDRSDDAEGAIGSAAVIVGEPLRELWMGLVGGLAVWLVLSLIATALAFLALCLWLSARGKLMFLDNVVLNGAEVRRPWAEYAREGNSLFLWSVGFFAVSVLAVGATTLPALGGLLTGEGLAIGAGTFISLGLGIPLIIAIAYAQLFLIDFIVPIMYAERRTTTEAWRRFLPIFRRHWGVLVLYGLLVFVIWIVIVALALVGGLMTCCLLWLLMAIPFIGTVFLLPVSVSLRAFSLDVLAQLDGELALPLRQQAV